METTVRPVLKIKRPKTVLFIFCYTVLFTGNRLLSLLLILMGIMHVKPGHEADFAMISNWSIAHTILIQVLELAGGILLFQLRRAAVGLLLTAFIISTGSLIYSFATTPMFGDLGIGKTIGICIFWVISGAIVWYSWLLKRQGVLR